ncbi:MAG: KH domain-containing protein [Acidimicrobiia bacterium]
MNEERDEVDDYDDDLEDDDEFDDDDDLDDEIAPEGNRIVGARAQAVVEHVTRQVADDADAIEVEVEERRGEIALLVHANPSDMGRLIGKRGRVIQALRQLVRAAGAAEGVKANVDVVE